jgi:hypothetical protein
MRWEPDPDIGNEPQALSGSFFEQIEHIRAIQDSKVTHNAGHLG